MILTINEVCARLNAIANHPAVLAHIAPGQPSIDLSGYVTPANEIFLDGNNAGLFIHQGDGVFEPHWMFVSARGKVAKHFTVVAISALFDKHPAATIIGHVPKAHMVARVMARAIGCEPSAESVDPYGRSCIVYKMERTRWVDLWAASDQWSAQACKPTQPATPQKSTHRPQTAQVNAL